MEELAEPLFERRVGFLIDGVEGTPFVPATLVALDDRRVVLETQYQQPSAWFGNGWTDDDWKMPITLGFTDELGECTLVDCRVTRTKSRGFSASFGKATARVGALLDGVVALDGDVEQAQEMRSTISGLHEWMGWRVSTQDYSTDAEGLIDTMTVHFKAPEPVRVASSAGDLTIHGHWRPAPSGTGTVEGTVVRTSSTDLIPWKDHASRHRTVRSLVSLCLWQGCDFLTHEVCRSDWPVRALSGDPIGPEWRRLITDRYRASSAGPQSVKSSTMARGVSFNDLGGEAGLAQWFDLAERHDRAVGPLVSVLYDRGSLEGGLTQVGIAMEAFAYQACVESGMGERAARDMRIIERTEKVVEVVRAGGDWAFDPGFDWPKMFADAYNAVKHANRPLPGVDELFAAYVTGAQILRRALLQEVGADHEQLNRVWDGYNWKDGIWPKPKP